MWLSEFSARLAHAIVVLGCVDESCEYLVERRSELSLHDELVEQPTERSELQLVLELLGNPRAVIVRIESGDPTHEMDRPIALRDLQPERTSIFPVRYAFDDAALGNELARSHRADAATRLP